MNSTPIVVMGVSGSGKTTIGTRLAARVGLPFVDGDQLHSPANIRKMAVGRPLDDADRVPWLKAIGALLERRPVVVACSALKRSYRDALREAAPNVRFIHLAGSKETLMKRIAARPHEFMPAAMLDSQLQTLEPPHADERIFTLNIEEAPAEMIESAVSWLMHRTKA